MHKIRGTRLLTIQYDDVLFTMLKHHKVFPGLFTPAVIKYRGVPS